MIFTVLVLGNYVIPLYCTLSTGLAYTRTSIFRNKKKNKTPKNAENYYYYVTVGQ